mmetsp:Transcript_127236/g.354267  ORF Transcript_127236/g.354267 Transcript_127236/m.354267 type:complete len:112 (-) Transcript_127236:177-512(-)
MWAVLRLKESPPTQPVPTWAALQGSLERQGSAPVQPAPTQAALQLKKLPRAHCRSPEPSCSMQSTRGVTIRRHSNMQPAPVWAEPTILPPVQLAHAGDGVSAVAALAEPQG